LPGIEALGATADAMPLPDASARAVTAAQAYHWFGPDAPREIHRLLEPDGVLALLWNERDDDDPLSAALEELTQRNRPGFGHDPDWQRPLDDSELYGPLRHRRFPHRGDETIEERVGTISYVGAMDESERLAFLAEVRRLCAGFGVDSSRPVRDGGLRHARPLTLHVSSLRAYYAAMQQKFQRQGAILRLVGEHELSTQAEVADALAAAGFEAVQTTVSRDIAELGLIKVRNPSGRLVYAVPGEDDARRTDELAAALRRFARELIPTGNLVVVRTPPGCANALGQALDGARLADVAGTVAGDDTIFVAARDGLTGAELEAELRHYLEGA
jgi:transcriptional regulator of arginine metabolism